MDLDLVLDRVWKPRRNRTTWSLDESSACPRVLPHAGVQVEVQVQDGIQVRAGFRKSAMDCREPAPAAATSQRAVRTIGQSEGPQGLSRIQQEDP